MTWPSALPRTTSAVPMVPPPPDRFSTTVDWPHAVCRCAASNRPITSVLPPAAAGTTRRTVSVGRQSEPKLERGKIAAAETAAAPVKTRRREKALIVTSSLPAESLFAGSVGIAGAESKRATWRRISASRNGVNQNCAALVKAEQLEQRRQVAELLAGRRRGAADEVEDLAVLQSVIGEPLHLAVLVEIDRDHALVDDLLVHERDFALGALRDVIEYLAVQGCDRRRRAHHDQHLVLAGADRDLLQRVGRQYIALLELLAGAPGERRTEQCHGRGRTEATLA